MNLLVSAIGAVAAGLAVAFGATQIDSLTIGQADPAPLYLDYAKQQGTADAMGWACAKGDDAQSRAALTQMLFNRSRLSSRLEALNKAGEISAGEMAEVAQAYREASRISPDDDCFPGLTGLAREDADKKWTALNGASVEG